MREPVSDFRGILRTGTLGHIRFFWPLNHIALQDLLVEVVLPTLKQATVFHLVLFSPKAFEHLFVLSPDLLPGPSGEVSVDQSEIGTV